MNAASSLKVIEIGLVAVVVVASMAGRMMSSGLTSRSCPRGGGSRGLADPVLVTRSCRDTESQSRARVRAT